MANPSGTPLLRLRTPPAAQDRVRAVPRLPSSLAPLLLTPLVLCVHGYHPWAGDAGIYIAGVRRILDPALYPLNAPFVTAFTDRSLFPWLLAGLVRLTRLPLAWILFAAHILSIALFLGACRLLAARLFASEPARWGAVVLGAACCSLPVAGTALVLMDPYVTARSFSTPLATFAVALCLNDSPARTQSASAWIVISLLLALTLLIHPLTGVCVLAFVILLALVRTRRLLAALALCAAALGVAGVAFARAHASPVSPAYREAVSLAPRSFLFLARWHWYEILGLVLPLLLLALALRRFPRTTPVGALCCASLLLGVTATLIAALFVPPSGPYPLVPLQVLRSFLILYAAGVVLLGGALSLLLRRSPFAAAAVLLLVFTGMFLVERTDWPDLARIEWPGALPQNPYERAFLWIRVHTPRSSVFAFDPQLVYQPGEDEAGFRVLSGRDQLADDKDAGIVAVIPSLAARWAQQRNAELPANSMSDAERRSRLAPLGANWLLLAPSAPTALPCPFANAAVKVCAMEQGSRSSPDP
jgi:hypothetical protein